ncbi:MAG TPA: STAS domain-containing protein [Kutzneria sp.]|jgi:anti-anti-sigma factor
MKPPRHPDDSVTGATAHVEDPGPELLEIVALNSQAGIRAQGQVDMAVRDQWESALARLTDEDAHEVHLDLTELTFIDVRGTVALVETARALDRGRQLVLQHPPEILIRILNTMWSGGLPTITIEAP